MNPLMFQPWPCGPSVNFRTVLSWPRMLFMNSLPVLLRLQRPLLISLCSLFQLSLIHHGGCLLHHEDRQSCLLCCGICSSACSALVYFSSALLCFGALQLLLLHYSALRLCLLCPGCLQLHQLCLLRAGGHQLHPGFLLRFSSLLLLGSLLCQLRRLCLGSLLRQLCLSSLFFPLLMDLA